jgi:enterochelin esterase family protein
MNLPQSIAQIRSEYLGNQRPVWVQPPRRPERCDHLTVFLDGEIYRDQFKIGALLDDLASKGGLADSWFVFVSNQSEEARWRECPCYPPFPKFVVKELLPWLEQLHPLIKRAKRRTLVGVSYTGLAATFVVHQYPGSFQTVISQSGSYWSNDCWLIGQIRKRRTPLARFYLDVGTRESKRNVRHRPDVFQAVAQIDSVRMLRDLLISRGDVVNYVEFRGGHTVASWKKTLPAALEWALPKPS